MKNILIASTIAIVLFSSCSALNKAAQTPDDVYYSPGSPKQDEYAAYTTSNDDNYLRMKVRNRYQWDGIDDYNYWNDSRYDFGFSCTPGRNALMYNFNPYMMSYYGFNNPFAYYYTSPWGTWYNPCYTLVYYKNPKVYYGNTSKSNLLAYRNSNYTNNRRGFGSLFKTAFNNNNSGVFNTNPSRGFSNNTTISNSAGGKSGGFNSSGSSSGSSRPPR